MRKSRFTPEQIVGILQEADAGGTIAEVCRRHGVTQTTFHRWRHKYGGMPPSDAKRLHALERKIGSSNAGGRPGAQSPDGLRHANASLDHQPDCLELRLSTEPPSGTHVSLRFE